MATIRTKRKGGDTRRAELIAATVAEIGESGSIHATMGHIARRAGISPALAYHYFGDKQALFLAVLRHILSQYGAEVRAALSSATTPRERAEAIVEGSFSGPNFNRETVAAWLNFYVIAQRDPDVRRLLDIYRRRLSSNLVHALRPDLREAADDAAKRISGLIDGLYLRVALDDGLRAADAAALVLHILKREFEEAS